MGWATKYIEDLVHGKTVQFRPVGNSMTGMVESGQLCTVVPADDNDLHIGDIVLCSVRGSQYLHLIKDVRGELFQIGNNKGHINGWIGREYIYGLLVRVE